MKIAVDAMGGDFAPRNIVEGAALALAEYSQIAKLFLVGDAAQVESELKRVKCNDRRIEIVHSTQVVEMGEDPLISVRKKRDSSIGRAVELVKKGDADAVMSAGHTGAAVASATIKLRMLEGIDRAGIAVTFPTETNHFVLIDAGANPDALPKHLLQYGVMGSVYSRHVLGYKDPSVGLLSIGAEEGKGNEFTKEVFELMKESALRFRGNVEGHDLFEKPVEVVVCQGFVGNVMLKSCEALAHAIFEWLRHEINRNPIRKVGGKLAYGAFKAIKKKMSVDQHGGQPLLGVDGIVIIAHGSSSPLAAKNAIRVGMESVEHQVNPHIVEEMKKFYDHAPQG